MTPLETEFANEVKFVEITLESRVWYVNTHLKEHGESCYYWKIVLLFARLHNE